MFFRCCLPLLCNMTLTILWFVTHNGYLVILFKLVMWLCIHYLGRMAWLGRSIAEPQKCRIFHEWRQCSLNLFLSIMAVVQWLKYKGFFSGRSLQECRRERALWVWYIFFVNQLMCSNIRWCFVKFSCWHRNSWCIEGVIHVLIMSFQEYYPRCGKIWWKSVHIHAVFILLVNCYIRIWGFLILFAQVFKN